MIKRLKMKYLVLKLSDEIDINMLRNKLNNYSLYSKVTIKDISIHIINCIIKK